MILITTDSNIPENQTYHMTIHFLYAEHLCVSLNRKLFVYPTVGCLVADDSNNSSPPAHVHSCSIIKCRIIYTTAASEVKISNSFQSLYLLPSTLVVKADSAFLSDESKKYEFVADKIHSNGQCKFLFYCFQNPTFLVAHTEKFSQLKKKNGSTMFPKSPVEKP